MALSQTKLNLIIIDRNFSNVYQYSLTEFDFHLNPIVMALCQTKLNLGIIAGNCNNVYHHSITEFNPS